MNVTGEARLGREEFERVATVQEIYPIEYSELRTPNTLMPIENGKGGPQKIREADANQAHGLHLSGLNIVSSPAIRAC